MSVETKADALAARMYTLWGDLVVRGGAETENVSGSLPSSVQRRSPQAKKKRPRLCLDRFFLLTPTALF